VETVGIAALRVETVARRPAGQEVAQGHGLGIAATTGFLSYIAAVVAVAVDEEGVVTIPRVDMAVDCGATVNPDRVALTDGGRVRDGRGPRDPR